jgi:hypothetical protein
MVGDGLEAAMVQQRGEKTTDNNERTGCVRETNLHGR